MNNIKLRERTKMSKCKKCGVDKEEMKKIITDIMNSIDKAEKELEELKNIHIR